MDPEFTTIEYKPLQRATTSFIISFNETWSGRDVLRDEIYFRINQADHPTTLNGPKSIWIDRSTGPQGDVVLQEGQRYIFNCSFRGFPTPTPEFITWTFNGTVIAPDHPSFTISHGHMVTHLTVEHAVVEHIGPYGCQVGNFLGDNHYRYSFRVE